MKIVLSIFTLIVSFVSYSSVVYSSPVEGVWLRKATGAHIQSYACKGGLGLKIVKASIPSAVGKVLMCGAPSVGSKKWKGKLKSIKDGNTCSGTLEHKSNDTLLLSGCVLGGLICKREIWTRVK